MYTSGLRLVASNRAFTFEKARAALIGLGYAYEVRIKRQRGSPSPRQVIANMCEDQGRDVEWTSLIQLDDLAHPDFGYDVLFFRDVVDAVWAKLCL